MPSQTFPMRNIRPKAILAGVGIGMGGLFLYMGSEHLFWFVAAPFSFFIYYSSERRYTNRKKVIARLKAAEIIEAHQRELTLKRKQLTTVGNYGLIDDSKWQREMLFFVENVIAPKIGNLQYFGYSAYGPICSLIDKATAGYQNTFQSFSPEMDPLGYERLVSDRLRDLGWDARTTVATGDQGIDVIAEKDGRKLVVQCKLYSSPVGNKAVQEVIAGKTFEQADLAAVVSNATFTPSAKQLASSAGVFLLHHDQLDLI